MKKISSVLIANRGEPVRRAARTLRKMGLRVVALSTEADLSSPWVAESDRVAVVSSYLDADQIVTGAIQAGADAVWPGWGFLSEKADFAEKVEAAGLLWIGPSPRVIALMGSKNEATREAAKAGLKTIPEIVIDGKDALPENAERVKAACADVGFPVLFKPAWGGGGQGQEIVRNADEIASKWESVCHVNSRQFQSGPVLVQRYFTGARHVEAQVAADRLGNAVILGERDCSMQRRNQKVIEEAPSPVLSAEERARLIRDSLTLVKAIGYDSAGTIEYLYSGGNFYFLEMNTRLQVEHTVTEEAVRVGGRRIDLVETMTRTAQGEELGFIQDEIAFSGHAVEARVYAEDPLKDFRPAPGTVEYVSFPMQDGLRVESAMGASSGEVSPAYDPMIAKVIASGKTREEAVGNLARALEKTVILGVPTNLSFCLGLLRDADFARGDYDTGFIARREELRGETPKEPGLACAIAGILRFIEDARSALADLRSPELTSFQRVMDLVPAAKAKYRLELREKTVEVEVAETAPRRFLVESAGHRGFYRVLSHSRHGHTVLTPEGRVIDARAYLAGNAVQLFFSGECYRFSAHREGERGVTADPHAAPMTGQVVSLAVTEGLTVSPGHELFQLESMKMITTVRATESGLVRRVLKKPGDAVKSGEPVVELARDADEKAAPSGKTRWHPEELLWPKDAPALADPDAVGNHLAGYAAEWRDAEDLEKTLSAFSRNDPEGYAASMRRILSEAVLFNELFDEHSHALTFLAERGSKHGRGLPEKTSELLKDLLPRYALKTVAELDAAPEALLRLFQAQRQDRRGKTDIICRALSRCDEARSRKAGLAGSLAAWLKIKPELDATEKENLLALLYKLDADRFHEIGELPVAPEYLEEYRHFERDPAHGIDAGECEALLSDASGSGAIFGPLDTASFPAAYRGYFQKWFAAFDAREIRVPRRFGGRGVSLFELRYADPKTQGAIEPRFLVVANVPDGRFEIGPSGAARMPGFERASIEAYRLLSLLAGFTDHRPNHVFLLSDAETPVPWKTRDDEGDAPALTPELARKIASRVSGFANGIRLIATEAVVPLVKVNTNARYLTIIEVRHAKPHGVISRPPFVIDERPPETPVGPARQLNENQHRMGKLINPDRAMLLFDEGAYEELSFPEADDVPGTGLNVYQGLVCGVPTLAYASDFRLRGGALGEREGKKLASAVVLAYLTGRVLVGFHDGAGANIKESVASLGWAGAYFGAIAHTGGFSDREKFRKWFSGHCERRYFEKVLRRFVPGKSPGELIDGVTSQLTHFHLHVGATVGMLVYGAAIAHLSLMNEHPEAYRVLTGAATVARVLGEKSSNEALGGAKVHAEMSGDIEMAFSSEEQVVNETRKLIKLFQARVPAGKIARSASLAPMDVPTEAGIILSRDGLRANLDHGEFHEIRGRLKNAGGLVTGYAKLGGSAVAVAAMATDYGLAHEKAFKKASFLVGTAVDNRLPLVFIAGAHWEAPSPPVSAQWLKERAELVRLLSRRDVPKIGMALGPRSIEKNVHHHMDVCIYVERGGETPGEAERARKIAPLTAKSLAQAFDQAAALLPYLTPEGAVAPAPDSPTRRVRQILPENLASGYDMRAVLNDLLDGGSFLELWAEDKLPLIVGFARLNGRAVGVIADDPLTEGGAQSVDSIAKFTRMHRLCERFGLPLVEFNDSPAFRPGSEQEHGGIQGEGGKSIREECLSPIPKIAVTLRQNYGGRLIHSNLVTLGPPRRGLVLHGTKIGVMGAKGAVTVLYRKKLEAMPEADRAEAERAWLTRYEREQLDPEAAVALGYVEKPVAMADLRARVIETLEEMTRS